MESETHEGRQAGEACSPLCIAEDGSAKYTFRNGRTVTFVRLNRNVVADLLKGFGDTSIPEGVDAEDPQTFSLLRKKYAKLFEANLRLFNYCAGWGIEEYPPEDEVGLLVNCGYDPMQVHALKTAWVMLCLLDTVDDCGQTEAGHFVACLLKWSFPDLTWE